jgi:hypothetical protein
MVSFCAKSIDTKKTYESTEVRTDEEGERILKICVPQSAMPVMIYAEDIPGERRTYFLSGENFEGMFPTPANSQKALPISYPISTDGEIYIARHTYSDRFSSEHYTINLVLEEK